MSADVRYLLRLRRILEHCDSVADRVERFLITRDSFVADSALRDLLLTPISQIGGIGGKLSEASRARCFGEGAWRRVRAFRNVFVHVYDRVDVYIARDVATQDMPALRSGVEAHLSSMSTDGGPGAVRSAIGSPFDGAPRV